MQIGNYTLSIFRPNSSIVLVDTTRVKYSGAKSIEWSYDDKNLIIEGPNGVNYMADLVNNTAETTTSPQIARDTWISELDKKRTAFVEKIDIPDNVRNIALSPKSEWSPDQKKFMYTVQSGDMMSYYVYNLEKPLPIGENRETTVMSLKASDPQPKLVWYPDSYHFVVVEGDILNNKKGTISLVRIDGTNKTEIYNNTLYSDLVFSSPSGDRILIITSFKSSGQTDLYSVSIR